MGNGASDSCCGLWVVDDRKNIERADRLHKSELYACRAWVPYVRHVERLLKKKRVAPFERGVCFLSPPGFVECPICFLSYRNINRTCCCDQPICTECALQIEPNLNRTKSCPCPFCRRAGFRVRWACARCHKDVAVTTISTTPTPLAPSCTST